MTGRHTGEHLTRELEVLVKTFGIEKKVQFFILIIYLATYGRLNEILSIVCDNASNNDTMIEAIDLEGFRGAESRTRCFPHIVARRSSV